MLETEMRNERTREIDKAGTLAVLRMLNEENRRAVDAVAEQLEHIALAADKAAYAISHGGRLIYAGAGTSGRLGVLDAAECPPTFGVEPGLVVALLAGGEKCMTRAAEGEEDDETAGRQDAEQISICEKDVLIGISAAGNAAYVAGAIDRAREAGAFTVGLTCNPDTRICRAAELAVITRTGPEAITSSTRMKAGTAQKLVLNMISTAAMIRTGKVYENFMINVRPANKKLRARCIWILTQLTGADPDKAEKALDKAGGDIRAAAAGLREGSL